MSLQFYSKLSQCTVSSVLKLIERNNYSKATAIRYVRVKIHDLGYQTSQAIAAHSV